MLKEVEINGKMVEYDDTEFQVKTDEKGQYLSYMGNGKGVVNPKGNTSCYKMFKEFKGSVLDLSNFDFSQISICAFMLSKCPNLTTVIANNSIYKYDSSIPGDINLRVKPEEKLKGEVVGTITEGVSDLKSVLSKISKGKGYGLTIEDSKYIVVELPTNEYHTATDYDIVKGEVPLPTSFLVKEYLRNELLQSNLDIYLSDDIMRTYLIYDGSSKSLVLWHYDIKKLELLNEITTLLIEDFYLEMNDHWSRSDYALSRQYSRSINDKKLKYKENYGELPKWNSIDYVMDERKRLKNILKLNYM